MSNLKIATPDWLLAYRVSNDFLQNQMSVVAGNTGRQIKRRVSDPLGDKKLRDFYSWVARCHFIAGALGVPYKEVHKILRPSVGGPKLVRNNPNTGPDGKVSVMMSAPKKLADMLRKEIVDYFGESPAKQPYLDFIKQRVSPTIFDRVYYNIWGYSFLRYGKSREISDHEDDDQILGETYGEPGEYVERGHDHSGVDRFHQSEYSQHEHLTGYNRFTISDLSDAYRDSLDLAIFGEHQSHATGKSSFGQPLFYAGGVFKSVKLEENPATLDAEFKKTYANALKKTRDRVLRVLAKQKYLRNVQTIGLSERFLVNRKDEAWGRAREVAEGVKAQAMKDKKWDAKAQRDYAESRLRFRAWKPLVEHDPRKGQDDLIVFDERNVAEERFPEAMEVWREYQDREFENFLEAQREIDKAVGGGESMSGKDIEKWRESFYKPPASEAELYDAVFANYSHHLKLHYDWLRARKAEVDAENKKRLEEKKKPNLKVSQKEIDEHFQETVPPKPRILNAVFATGPGISSVHMLPEDSDDARPSNFSTLFEIAAREEHLESQEQMHLADGILRYIQKDKDFQEHLKSEMFREIDPKSSEARITKVFLGHIFRNGQIPHFDFSGHWLRGLNEWDTDRVDSAGNPVKTPELVLNMSDLEGLLGESAYHIKRLLDDNVMSNYTSSKTMKILEESNKIKQIIDQSEIGAFWWKLRNAVLSYEFPNGNQLTVDMVPEEVWSRLFDNRIVKLPNTDRTNALRVEIDSKIDLLENLLNENLPDQIAGIEETIAEIEEKIEDFQTEIDRIHDAIDASKNEGEKATLSKKLKATVNKRDLLKSPLKTQIAQIKVKQDAIEAVKEMLEEALKMKAQFEARKENQEEDHDWYD